MLIDLVRLARHLRRSRVSALTAVVTLALTLGAAASIFAVVDVVLLTPPPFANPTELVNVGEMRVNERTDAVPRRVGDWIVLLSGNDRAHGDVRCERASLECTAATTGRAARGQCAG
jgi:hypothetical protein